MIRLSCYHLELFPAISSHLACSTRDGFWFDKIKLLSTCSSSQPPMGWLQISSSRWSFVESQGFGLQSTGISFVVYISRAPSQAGNATEINPDFAATGLVERAAQRRQSRGCLRRHLFALAERFRAGGYLHSDGDPACCAWLADGALPCAATSHFRGLGGPRRNQVLWQNKTFFK